MRYEFEYINKGSVDYYEDLPTSWMKVWDIM